MVRKNINWLEDRAVVAQRGDWKILLALFTAALLVRLIRLFYLDVWFDEVAILFQLPLSFGEIWNFCKTENFPPLYPWLMKLWGTFCTSSNWMRFASAVIGAAVPPAAYLMGREISGKRLGVLLGLACIISLPLYYYSQMIRMYALFALLACLSHYGFLRAMRTGEWKYWIMTALVNLAGFYTFLFMIILIFSEFLVLLYFFRLDLKRYRRPVMAHLPALAIMALWLVPFLSRYQAVQSYIEDTWKLRYISDLWIFLGTGHKEPYRPFLMTVANLPFLIGLLLGIRKWATRPAVLASALVGGISLLAIILISLRHSIFVNRYMLFLLPLYLALVLYGCLELRSRIWSRLGLGMVFGALLFGQGYYWTHYQAVNDHFRHHGLYSRSADDDGRSMSRMAALIRERLGPGEVVIHYGPGYNKTLTFFNFVYYHKYSLPEFVYSLGGIVQHSGRQYLRPGEEIKSLHALPQIPDGIWVITLIPTYIILKGSHASREAHWIIAAEGDLPSELKEFGFEHQETIRDGAMTAIHFRRIAAADQTSDTELEK